VTDRTEALRICLSCVPKITAHTSRQAQSNGTTGRHGEHLHGYARDVQDVQVKVKSARYEVDNNDKTEPGQPTPSPIVVKDDTAFSIAFMVQASSLTRRDRRTWR
jgi:hypothetical protein